MRPAEILARGGLYFESVQRGMKEHQSESIYLGEEQAYERLLDIWKRHGMKNGYTDFYYFLLGEDSQKLVRENLTEEECDYLDSMTEGEDEEDMIYPLDLMLLRIVTRLNAREILFSTIYFLDDAQTWWGNYKEEYIVFKKKV